MNPGGGKPRIGVIGQSGEVPPEMIRAADVVGREIAKRGGILFCGGRDGVMEACCKGAVAEGGITVGILPYDDPTEGNPYLTVPVTTGLDFEYRSMVLIHAVDAVIMIGGGCGTLTELATAYLNCKPVIVLDSTGGWAARVKWIALESKYLDERKNTELAFVEDPVQAVAIAFEACSAKKPPNRRAHHG
ncbi:MAG TPA: TIGR00725 family protein [Firmicutes bacterium]|nr:TIGR00725 family protein [Bacillota bacterium]